MTKKNLMPTIVLVIICLVTALLMGGVNMLTKDRINANAEAAANEALKVVLPNGKSFEKIEELPEEYPDEITAAYKADGGYVFRQR
jgi:Na+-translocating ferredoxin:NAD+ oxidoreductase RnfG subunit